MKRLSLALILITVLGFSSLFGNAFDTKDIKPSYFDDYNKAALNVLKLLDQHGIEARYMFNNDGVTLKAKDGTVLVSLSGRYHKKLLQLPLDLALKIVGEHERIREMHENHVARNALVYFSSVLKDRGKSSPELVDKITKWATKRFIGKALIYEELTAEDKEHLIMISNREIARHEKNLRRLEGESLFAKDVGISLKEKAIKSEASQPPVRRGGVTETLKEIGEKEMKDIKEGKLKGKL